MTERHSDPGKCIRDGWRMSEDHAHVEDMVCRYAGGENAMFGEHVFQMLQKVSFFVILVYYYLLFYLFGL